MSRDLVPETRYVRVRIVQSEVVVLVLKNRAACKACPSLEPTENAETLATHSGGYEVDTVTLGTFPRFRVFLGRLRDGFGRLLRSDRRRRRLRAAAKPNSNQVMLTIS